MAELYIQVTDPLDVYFARGQAESITGVQVAKVYRDQKITIDIRDGRLNSLVEQDYLDYLTTLPEVAPILHKVSISETLVKIELLGMGADFTTVEFRKALPTDAYSLVFICYTAAGSIVTPTLKVGSKTINGFDIWVDTDCFIDVTATV